MKFCDEKIQKHLLNGGKIKRISGNGSRNYRPIMLDGDLLIFADNGDDYNITRDDLTATNWEIAEPEYDWDKIIKDKILCIFSDIEDFRYKTISTLRNIENEQYYTKYGTRYNHCEPFNPTEFNIAKNLKDYEK